MTWTRLTCLCVKKRLTIRLRFGEPTRSHRMDSGATRCWFIPGQVFAVRWWARLSPRRQFACFAVIEALDAGDASHRLPAIEPAVRVHTFLSARCVGKDRRVVDRAEALIRRIEHDEIDPCRVPSAHYRAAGQSLRVGREPRRLNHADFLRVLKEKR